MLGVDRGDDRVAVTHLLNDVAGGGGDDLLAHRVLADLLRAAPGLLEDVRADALDEALQLFGVDGVQPDGAAGLNGLQRGAHLGGHGLQDGHQVLRAEPHRGVDGQGGRDLRAGLDQHRVLVVPSGNEPQGPGQASGDGAQSGEGHQLGPRGLGVGEGVGERVQAGELRRQGAGTDAGAVQDHQLRGPLRRPQEAAHLGIDLPGPQQGDPGEELEAGDPHPAGLDVLGQGQGLNLVGGDVVGQEQDVVGVQQPDRQHGGGGEGAGVGGQGDGEVGRVAHRCFSWEMGAAPSAGAAGVSGMRVRWKDWWEREAVGPRWPW